MLMSILSHTGPPYPPDQLLLLSYSAHEVLVSWVVVFDGNDPIVMYYIFVWNNNANVSCCGVNSSVNSWVCV